MTAHKNHEGLMLFKKLSAIITGFTVADIEGTGMAKTYLDVIKKELGEVWTKQLLITLSRYDLDRVLKNNDHVKKATINSVGIEEVLHDKKYSDQIKLIIYLWYTGQWNGANPYIISSAAYIEGFIWKAIGAHPMGAKQPGFDTWSFPPLTFSSTLK